MHEASGSWPMKALRTEVPQRCGEPHPTQDRGEECGLLSERETAGKRRVMSAADDARLKHRIRLAAPMVSIPSPKRRVRLAAPMVSTPSPRRRVRLATPMVSIPSPKRRVRLATPMVSIPSPRRRVRLAAPFYPMVEYRPIHAVSQSAAKQSQMMDAFNHPTPLCRRRPASRHEPVLSGSDRPYNGIRLSGESFFNGNIRRRSFLDGQLKRN